jgi:hypothetical protein
MKLMRLLTEHADQIKLRKYDLFGQALVGVTYSLWRAAFLADKSGMREQSFQSAIRFLGTVIADNAINYTQDKQEREWTFNYYTNNVRYTMIKLAKDYPDFVPKWKSKDRPPKKRSRYGQDQLTETVQRFENALRSRASGIR